MSAYEWHKTDELQFAVVNGRLAIVMTSPNIFGDENDPQK